MLDAWQRLHTGQKIALITGVALLILAVCVSVTIATAPNYVQLYGNMTSADAALVVQKLQEQKIKYRLTNNGSSVEVPSDKVDELRLSLAGEGLPRGGNVGFEIFNETQLGQSEFAEQLKYKRALQGELARTIGELDCVRSARVHLAIPERRLYSEEQLQPTATVVLDLQGPDPTPNEIKSVVHLVSSAVEGLKPENVTVVDTQKKLLSDLMTQTTAGNPGTRMRAERDAALALEGRVQSMLDTVLGPEKSIVRANVILNFDHKEYNREIYTPVGTLNNSSVQIGVLETQQTTHEAYYGKNAVTAGGPVGTAAALAPVIAGSAGSAGKNGDYVHEENTAKYVVPKTVEHVTVTPGEIQRINLALFVDESVGADQVTNLQKIVAAAVGIDAARGDVIEVQPIKFDQTINQEEEKLAKADARNRLIAMVTKYGLGGLMILGFLFILFAVFRSTLGSVPAQVMPQAPLLPDSHLAPELPMLEIPMMTMPSSVAETYAEQQDLSLTDPADIPVEYDFNDVDPQRVAQVIRGLMAED